MAICILCIIMAIRLLLTIIMGIIDTVTEVKKNRYEKLLFWVDTAVKAAENIYGSEEGRQKKEYVVRFLLSKEIVFDVDEVSALIDKKVYEIKYGKE